MTESLGKDVHAAKEKNAKKIKGAFNVAKVLSCKGK
jgi:hypothetical protein